MCNNMYLPGFRAISYSHCGPSLLVWFRCVLPSALVNPHQIRSHGHSLCDDPRDPHWELGFDVGNLITSLMASGPNLYSRICVPSNWELSPLPIVELTTPHWNSCALMMPANMLSHRYMDKTLTSTLAESVSLLGSILEPLDPRSLYTLHAAVSCSATVTDCNSGVSLSIAITVTGWLHSSVSNSENFAWTKWDIGINTAKRTFQVTTQRGARTTIHPFLIAEIKLTTCIWTHLVD